MRYNKDSKKQKQPSRAVNPGRKRKKMKYYTADKETGTFIDEFDTYAEAAEAIEDYEKEDKKDGVYVKDFYDIVDYEHCRINSDEGKEIAELRRKAGFTQQAAADYLGVPRRTFQSWEYGERLPTAFVFNTVKEKLIAKIKEG